MKRRTMIIGGVAAAVVIIGIAAAATSGNKGSANAASAAPVTITAPPSTVYSTVLRAAPEVTLTETAPPPAPVTVTVTAQADAPTADPAGPKDDGTYLVGSEIATGNWKCEKATDTTFWTVHAASNDIVDNGFSGVATISDEGFTAEFSRCGGSWTKVG